jgi:Na+/H+ antiporter NhaC
MNPTSPVKPGRKIHFFIQWFDILFIMALCFLTLLTTMLMRGKVLVGNGSSAGLDYTFGFGSCTLVVLLFVVYLRYMLTHSEGELKDMVRHVYGPPPTAAPSPPVQSSNSTSAPEPEA